MHGEYEEDLQTGLRDPEENGRSSIGLGIVFLIAHGLLAGAWWLVVQSPMAFAKTYKHWIYVTEVAEDIGLALLAISFLCLTLALIFLLVGFWQRFFFNRRRSQ